MLFPGKKEGTEKPRIARVPHEEDIDASNEALNHPGLLFGASW